MGTPDPLSGAVSRVSVQECSLSTERGPVPGALGGCHHCCRYASSKPPGFTDRTGGRDCFLVDGDVTYWTVPFPVSFPVGTPGPLPKWQTRMYAPIAALAAGTYFVDADLRLTKRLYDGLGFYQPGAWFPITGCQMTIT